MQRFYNGIFLIPFFMLGFTIQAQVNSVSPYSRLGLGEFTTQNYVRSLGFAGANLAIPDPFNINFTNPASYSHLELTTFSVGFAASVVEQEQINPDISVTNNNAGLRYFAFGLPVKDWWGSAIGIQPFTARGYDISTNRLGPDSIEVNDRFVGTGGLNRIYWGNAFDVAEGLSLGVNANFIFGSLRDQNILTWSNGVNNSVIDQDVSVTGFSFDYGALYKYQFDNRKELAAGVKFTNSTALSAKMDWFAYITNQPGLPLDSVVQSNSDASVVLPNEFSVGLAYGQKTPNTLQYAWAVTADLEFYQGSEFEDFRGRKNLVNAYRAELGGYITPSLASDALSRDGNYLTQIEYRLGGYYDQTPFEVNGEQISELGITFGLGLPVRQRGLGPGEVKQSMIHTGVVLGQRGSLDHGLIRERFVQVFVGITLNDKWFIQYKYR